MFWPFELLGGFAIIAFALTIAAAILFIWALVDCLQNPRIQGMEKLIWVLVILFLPLLGAIIYLIVARQQRMLGS